MNNPILRRFLMVVMLIAFGTPVLHAQSPAPTDYNAQKKLSEKNAKKTRKAEKKQAKKIRKANAKAKRDYNKKHSG